MATLHKHHPINLQEVLNTFDHTLILSKQLGWKHLKHEMQRIQRTHDLIQKIFDDKNLAQNVKIDEVCKLVLHYYQEELAFAKAADAAEFVKKINQRNDHLYYARMLGLILRDLSPKIDDSELNKLIKARKVEMIREAPHDPFYDISPIKETTMMKKETKQDYTVHPKKLTPKKHKAPTSTVAKTGKVAKTAKVAKVATKPKKPTATKLKAKAASTKPLKAKKRVTKSIKATAKKTK